MTFEAITNFIQSCGFPIACCVYLFYQNNKYQQSLSDLGKSIEKMSNLLTVIKKNLEKGG